MGDDTAKVSPTLNLKSFPVRSIRVENWQIPMELGKEMFGKINVLPNQMQGYLANFQPSGFHTNPVKL